MPSSTENGNRDILGGGYDALLNVALGVEAGRVHANFLVLSF